MTTETRNARIRSLYAGGYSLRKIADAEGISHERVRQVLLQQGVPLRSSAKRKLDGALKTLATPISTKA